MKQLLETFPNPHKYILAAVASILAIVLLLPSESAVASKPAHAVVANYASLAVGKEYPLPLELKNISTEVEFETYQKHVEIRNGDSLATIFKREKLPQKTMLAIVRSGDVANNFTKLVVGKELTFEFDQDDQFIALYYPLDAIRTLSSKLTDEGGFVATIEDKEIVTTERYFEGHIASNFWNAGTAAGLTDNLIMNLANVFAWDVDFALDIREGDKFYTLVEEIYVDGEFAGFGDILAAEFVNQDDTFTAVRYTDGRYYTPDGDSMRKAFLRAPVSFKYISSNFTNRRYHPVQKRYKAHRGVDYAASTGTPVVAAGDGKVIRSGYDKFNGHHVFVEHGGGITTKYIHFSKRKVKTGQRVKQGQLIGLVGSTGLAAGPHLHYEFLVNGTHRNPRTVSLPKANPIAGKEKPLFLSFASERLGRLNHSKNLLLAMR
ncbi:peptidoglycan DD-metalloendopeptidase family protein [Psychrosphaera sp. B3R10]|uniref:Peptidoglycan DD-metalloendopeptidase family protein n=1 Tax=Psychrosphaera algicola TaxID=3023714 RepID=A0ABT5FHS6_9GAMM|nr:MULTISPECIES: peptidoglycan DD-metalloendopeptidase family protein [unclassified Psychrosphaera]MBU2880741.1 peptidoglycan DD-metalloendopeptidase family protein [Psychrosphaera sp. I2R16]MBU2991513.1 peptidoglycan DD-metalloendopeptidase family protein [Psychrosphaera sp. B3R10]MDC2890749.1 peptidoglycan DD-metalloendopeptidase family protein [Psychrosphaera sp. G1-22]MDO6719405.1 peptidoglycan DD-metalloendopeptidase family protein [Psychrosphaera sp. 1_MG-2023]